MKSKIVIGCLILFVSCKVTEDKAIKYLDEHPEAGSKYCVTRYPIVESIDTTITIDTAGFESSIRKVLTYADSVLIVAEAKNQTIKNLWQAWDAVRQAKEVTDSQKADLQARIEALRPIDVPALRKSIEAELRSKIKPCNDTTIEKTQESSAKVSSLQYQNANLQVIKEAYLKMKQDKKDLSIVFGWFLGALIRKWWFWLIVVGLGAWVYFRIKAGAINGIIKRLR